MSEMEKWKVGLLSEYKDMGWLVHIWTWGLMHSIVHDINCLSVPLVEVYRQKKKAPGKVVQ